jgi:transposase
MHASGADGSAVCGAAQAGSGPGRTRVFVPQSYDWGVEAQVDWYEAYADLDGERIKLQVFEMRSMASGAAFHRAYPCATQQAFLEAHELAFEYFEGVFRRLRYDNLSSAVKKILRGQQRELTARFIAFRSHWQYQAEFCTPGEGHEKGGVEGEVGYFRRNHWVPVPVAADLQALNRKLLEDCRADEGRIMSGQSECVGARLLTRRSIFCRWPPSPSIWPRSASRASIRQDARRCGRTPTRCR